MIKRLATIDDAIRVIETRVPHGLFYLDDNGAHVAIDNTTGDAWTEEFGTQAEAKIWLTGEENEALWQEQS